jgi:hypothetical protein
VSAAAACCSLNLELTRQEANRLCQLFRRQINHNKQTYGIVQTCSKKKPERCTGVFSKNKNNVCVAPEPEIDFSCQRSARSARNTRLSVRLFSLHANKDAHVHVQNLLRPIVLRVSARNYIVMSAKWIQICVLVFSFESRFFQSFYSKVLNNFIKCQFWCLTFFV